MTSRSFVAQQDPGTSRRRRAWRGRDDGRISVLIAGLLGILALLILGAVDVTAVQLARMRIIDAADSAASDAADAIDEGAIYGRGVGQELTLTDGSVQQVAGTNLGRQTLPTHVTSWGLQPGTGSPDGRTAVVILRGNVDPPITGGLLGFLGDVPVTVESRARADVSP